MLNYLFAKCHLSVCELSLKEHDFFFSPRFVQNSSPNSSSVILSLLLIHEQFIVNV